MIVGSATLSLAAKGRNLDKAEGFFAEGEKQREAGDLGRAIDNYSKAIRLNPYHFNAYASRSKIYAEQKLYDLAAADLVPLINTGAIAVGPETPQQEAALRDIPQAAIIMAASYLRKYYEDYDRYLVYQLKTDSARIIADRALETFPESFYLTVALGHVPLLNGDTVEAKNAYHNSLGLLTSMDELLSGPLKDFEVFAENNWQTEASRRMGEWLKEQFKLDGKFYLKAVKYFSKAAELADQKKFLEAPEFIDKAIEAEQGAAHPRYDFLSQITSAAGDFYSQAYQYYKALYYYEKALGFAQQSGGDQAVSIQLDKMATVFKLLGKFDKALKHYQQALVIDRKLGDEENIAADLRKIGKVYYAWGRYEDALNYHQQALVIDKKLGKDENLSDDLNEIGVVYHAQAQYDKAIDHYNQVMAIGRRLGADELVAVCFNNIGMVYNDWGKYDKALDHFQRARELYDKLGKEDNLAITLNNIGLVYDAWGRYDKALEYYENALEYDRKLEKEADIAVRLNNIGMVYNAWGKYDKAIDYYQQALEIDRKLGKEGLIPSYLSNIGKVYRAWEKYDQAIDYYRQALEIDQKLGQEGNIGKDLINIGSVYYDQGLYDKAIEHFETAREMDQKLGKESNVAQDLGYAGKVFLAWGKHLRAQDYFLKALAIQKKIGEDPSVAATLSDLGKAAFGLGRYSEAEKYFNQSISLIEKIRLTAKGDVRRDYLASQLTAYQWLALTNHKAGKPAEALKAIEQSRAKYLVEQMGERMGARIAAFTGVKEWQKKIDANTAVVCFANIDLDQPLALVMTAKGIRTVLLDKAAFDSAVVSRCDEAIKTALDTLESVSAPEPSNERKAAELFRQDKERAGFERIVNFYRYLLTKPRLKGKSLENFRSVSRQLYGLLFGSIEQDIAEKSDLIVLPDGILGFIPFETLMPADSAYLVERFNIRYAQSLTVMDIIAERRYDPNREPLAAFGGAVYQPDTYAREMAQAETDYQKLKQIGPAPRSADQSASSGAVWHNLPGTLVEVKMIKDIQDQAVVFTGDDVEEAKIKKLSTDGWLRNYRVIHFATHGQVDLAKPELSAVVLSQYDPPRNGEDGYLRVSEVAGLGLNADLANLSACETGLGKIYGGEGVVGLTQAFLLAGANGLSVSLWQVADESTMRFMVGIYRLVKETGMAYPKAITEIKRQFIKGGIGQGAYQNPYFWAPFVYYGQ
ncbi:MAG: CHAT domain-containing tetratricopeptide repeat protein [Candidatus Edwardsbacteria bacterium]|nr:CHAT domain-containing tetratricopeptide repeat protein [Candidatus Edwardsbacteria bacterium]